MQVNAEQVTGLPYSRAQQVNTLPLQATTLPATTTAAQTLDINTLIQPLITIMIVMMMMKMMTGAMAGMTS